MEIGINLCTLEWAGQWDEVARNLLFLEIGICELPIQLWQENSLQPNALKGIRVPAASGLLHRTSIFPESIFCSESIFQEQLLKIPSKLHIAKELSCSSFSIGIDPWSHRSYKESLDILESRMQVLDDLLSPYQFSINLEYISHKLSPQFPGATLFCKSLSHSLELIHRINCRLNRPNIKLLLDSMHWFADEKQNDPKDFIDLIGLVHLADYRNANKNELDDLNRVLPFEGQLPLHAFLRSLSIGGYTGLLTVEVFRSESYSPSLLQIRESLSTIKKELSHELYHSGF